VRSKNFALRTDVAPLEAQKVLALLEEALAMLSPDLGHLNPKRLVLEEPIDVVAFDRHLDFAQIKEGGTWESWESWRVLARPKGADAQPLLSLSTGGWQLGVILGDELRLRPTVWRIVAEWLVHRLLPRPPAWLVIALAQYYETTRKVATGVIFGVRPWVFSRGVEPLEPGSAGITRPVSIQMMPTIREVWRATAEEMANPWRGKLLRIASWGLLHLLQHRSPADRQRFHEYLALLARGLSPSVAWGRVFTEAVTQELEAAFREYLVVGTERARQVPFSPPPVAPAGPPRVLSDEEIHLWWAKLRPWNGARSTQVDEDLSRAVQRRPSLPEAHYWRAFWEERRGGLDRALAELRLATAAEPREARYWNALSRILGRAGRAEEADEAVQKLEAVAAWGEHLETVAQHYANRGKIEPALAAARRAVRADAACWRCWDTLATLLERAGQTEQAQRTRNHARNLKPDGTEAVPSP
jgi:Tfp pilus assembly protein PilF